MEILIRVVIPCEISVFPEMKVASLASSNTTFLDDIFHRPRDEANKNAPRAPNFRNDRG